MSVHSSNNDGPDRLPISDDAQPPSVPVFNCLVYLSSEGENVHARVANLAGLECDAGSEREALSKIIPAFKARVTELHAQGEPIPWIEPPLAAEKTEQKRFIPVHL